jgi:hypothetical protein
VQKIEGIEDIEIENAQALITIREGKEKYVTLYES